MSRINEFWQLLTRRQSDFRLVAILASMPLFLFSVLNADVLNSDAFYFLRAAELITQQGLTATLGDYGWHSGYALIVALIDRVLPVDAVTAAYLLNFLCYAVLVWSFITLSMTFRNTPVVSGIAALCILFLPNLSELRDYIIRDFGYWAFSLAGLVMLIRYHKQPGKAAAAAYAACMTLALIFRAETFILLFIAPFSLFFNRQLGGRSRLQCGLVLVAFSVLPLGFLALIAALADSSFIELPVHAWRNYLPFLLDFQTVLSDTSDAVNEALFFEDFYPGHGPLGPFVMLFAYLITVIINILRELPPVLVLLLAWGLWLRAYQCDHQGRVAIIPACTFFFSVCLYLFVFIAAMRFSTGRYAMLASLILLAFLPLCVERLLIHARENGRQRRFNWIFGVLLTFFIIDGLISFGYSKHHIAAAGNWLASADHGETELVTNDFSMAYRSGLVPDYDTLDTEPAWHVDNPPQSGLLALSLKHDEISLAERLSEEEMTLIRTFSNERNDQVRIYRVGP